MAKDPLGVQRIADLKLRDFADEFRKADRITDYSRVAPPGGGSGASPLAQATRLIQQRRDAKLCSGLFDSFIHLPGRDTDVFQTEAHLLPQGIHAELQVGILEQHRQVGGTLLGVQCL